MQAVMQLAIWGGGASAATWLLVKREQHRERR
jgi:hypothetical protein